MIPPTLDQIFATCLFGLAIAHTFSVNRFRRVANRFPKGSVKERFFHLLGEVETVFGLWAALYVAWLAIHSGFAQAAHFVNEQKFTEPLFVFAIMAMSATRPILGFVHTLIGVASKTLPWKSAHSYYVSALILGPLLGSFITEPAAMTVTALLLKEAFYDRGTTLRFKYSTLGLLFVNVSIGGTLTPFAAPPVLMVASTWGWNLSYMLTHFGWKAFCAVILSTFFTAFLLRRELNSLAASKVRGGPGKSPAWLTASHLCFLSLLVVNAHQPAVFMSLLILFMGLVTVSQKHQSKLQLKEALLVAVFLAGLVVLGGPQRWWLEPLLSSLSSGPLFVSSALLTAITDNAAITYLGSLVPTLPEASKYALVAGAVTGGGLTVIANAPNPAGYGILRSSFGADGIRPFGLFKAALLPTLFAALLFWFLPF